MMHRGNWVLLCSGVFTGVLSIAMGMAGCQAQQGNNTGSGGDGGNDTAAPSSSSGMTSSSGTGMGGGGTGGSEAGGGGMGGGGPGGGGPGGGGPSCDGKEVTVYDVTGDPKAANPVSEGTAVKLKGVVAMSQKHLVSKSNTTGSCLWGVFVSAGDVTTTAPYSGTQVLSFGHKAILNPSDNKSYCPKLGEEEIGDAIPDDVKPGDVLDVVGKTASFLSTACNDGDKDETENPTGNTIAQRQIATACLVAKTGQKVTPPAGHVFSDPAEIAKLVSPSDKTFHDMWGGVKVRIEGPTAITHPKNPPKNDLTPVFVNDFGELMLKGSNALVGDKIYYRGYAAAKDACHAGPTYASPVGDEFLMKAVEGINTLSFCTWTLQPNNKCTDLDPSSEDCANGGPGGTPLMCE